MPAEEYILKPTDDSIPPAGVIGRALRAVAGSYQLYFVWSAAKYFSALRYQSFDDQPVFWAFAAFGIYLLPWAINLGFHRVFHISRYRSFGLIAFGALLAAVSGFLIYASVWQPVLSTSLIVAAMYAHGHIGISNLLAAIVGIKGCEMRVIPYLINRISGKETEFALCPGLWTPIDRWEADVWKKFGSG